MQGQGAADAEVGLLNYQKIAATKSRDVFKSILFSLHIKRSWLFRSPVVKSRAPFFRAINESKRIIIVHHAGKTGKNRVPQCSVVISALSARYFYIVFYMGPN